MARSKGGNERWMLGIRRLFLPLPAGHYCRRSKVPENCVLSKYLSLTFLSLERSQFASVVAVFKFR